MATITTTNTRALIQDIADIFVTGAKTEIGSPAHKIVNNADYLKNASPNSGGGLTTDVSRTAGSWKGIEKYKDYMMGGYQLNGSSSMQFTGKNLDDAANAQATAYKYSLNRDSKYASSYNGPLDTQENSKQTLTAKLALNVQNSASWTLTQANTSDTYKGITAGLGQVSSSKFSGLGEFNGTTLKSFTIKDLSLKSTYTRDQNKVKDVLQWSIKSKAGLEFDSSDLYSGAIDSFSFSNIFNKNDGTAFKATESLSTKKWTQDMIDALSDYYASQHLPANLNAFIEALLAGDDTIKGGSMYSNDLYGGAGNDKLTGQAGDDRLLGGTGNDQLNGGKGADLLVGGAGVDKLTGGAGPDQFVFFSGDSSLTQSEMDVITDFKIGDGDKLVFKFSNAVTLNDDNVVIALDKDQREASFDALHMVAQDAAYDYGVRVYVGMTGKDSKHAYAFVDLNGDGQMDMGIKLAGVTSAGKITLTGISADMSDYDGFQSITYGL
jgi:Ca2+-binding RTX toxin-like protein